MMCVISTVHGHTTASSLKCVYFVPTTRFLPTLLECEAPTSEQKIMVKYKKIVVTRREAHSYKEYVSKRHLIQQNEPVKFRNDSITCRSLQFIACHVNKLSALCCSGILHEVCNEKQETPFPQSVHTFPDVLHQRNTEQKQFNLN